MTETNIPAVPEVRNNIPVTAESVTETAAEMPSWEEAEQILRSGLRDMALNADAAGQLIEFGKFLLERNQVMNLTAITNPADVVRLHFLDCAALAGQYDFRGRNAVDVGSGAGFPGIPLKLLIPSLQLTALDARQKRVNFLREACGRLKLSGTECIAARAEEFAAEHRELFDFALSRAVAELPILAELCLPLVRTGGYFLAMKSVSSDDEIRQAAHAIQVLGGKQETIWDYAIPGTDVKHRLIAVRKIRGTPARYPRAYGKIKKSPL